MKTVNTLKQGRGEQVKTAEKIEMLSNGALRSFERRWLKSSGEQLTTEQREEIGNIFRCEMIKAAIPRFCGGLGWIRAKFTSLPSSFSSVFGGLATGKRRKECADNLCADGADWRDVLLVRRAIAKGSKMARSWIFGRGAERVFFVPLEWKREDGSTVPTVDSEARRGFGDGGRVQRRGVPRARAGVDGKRALDRELLHLKATLAVYHFLVKNSRESKSAFRADCDFLKACRMTARGHGFSHWSAEFVGNGQRASKAATNRFDNLRKRIEAAELRIQSTPKEAESIISALGLNNAHPSLSVALGSPAAAQIPGRIRPKAICAYPKGKAQCAPVEIIRAAKITANAKKCEDIKPDSRPSFVCPLDRELGKQVAKRGRLSGAKWYEKAKAEKANSFLII